jgi:hypothetical protein
MIPGQPMNAILSRYEDSHLRRRDGSLPVWDLGRPGFLARHRRRSFGASWGLAMPLIYNRILTHFSGLNSVALNAAGDLAAVCVDDRELHVYRIIEGPRNAASTTTRPSHFILMIAPW